MGQDDPVGLYTLAGEEIDDLMPARTDLGVDEDRRTRLAAADRRGNQPPFFKGAYALVRGSRLDYTSARGVEGGFRKPVIGVHPPLQIQEDPLRQQFHGRIAHPMTLFVVGIAVVTGRADEMDARRLSDGPQLSRSPAET